MYLPLLPLVFKRQPVLRISAQGILISPLPIQGGSTIAWSEIAAFSSGQYMYKYLCIYPKDPESYLKRFKAWERLIRKSNGVLGMPVLTVPQRYLEKPVEEILSMLYDMCGEKLGYSTTQFRPEDQPSLPKS